MKNIFYILIIILFSSLSAKSQTKVDTLWTNILGGSGFENPEFPVTSPLYQTETSMVSDKQDNLYILTGTRSNDKDVKIAYGFTDAWLIKMNSQGDTLWTLVIGGSYDDVACDLVLDKDGGCIVVGYTFSSDGVFTNSGHHGTNEDQDGFLAFIDKDGKIKSVKQYGSSYKVTTGADGTEVGGGGVDELYSIIATSDGNYMCVGYSNSFSDDLGPLDASQYVTGWFLKISPEGKKLSSKKISHDIDERYNYLMKLFDVVEDEPGVFVAFGELLAASGNSFFWAVKTDGMDDTKKEWSEIYTSHPYTQGFAGLTKEKNGNYAVCTYTVSRTDNQFPALGGADIWLFEIDKADGTILNQNSYGGAAQDIPKDIITLNSGNLLITGTTSSTDGDAFGGNGGSDFWILEINQNTLDTLRMHKFGGTGNDVLYSACESQVRDAFFVAGYSDSKDSYVLENNGETDIYVAKIQADPTLSVEKLSNSGKNLECILTNEKNVYNLLNAQNSTIYIFDILGKQVDSKRVYTNTEKLDFTNYGKGIYLLKTNDNSTKACKIIIE